MSPIRAADPTAHAADPAPADANAAAAAIEDVAPEVEAVEFVERADKAKASIDAGTVTTSDSAVSLDVKGTPAGLTIDLPVPADAELVVANDGTAVYASESPVDVAVQAHENGVRVQTVLDSKAAPERFAYTPGANDTIVQNPDGSVIIYSLDPATDAILVTESPPLGRTTRTAPRSPPDTSSARTDSFRSSSTSRVTSRTRSSRTRPTSREPTGSSVDPSSRRSSTSRRRSESPPAQVS